VPSISNDPNLLTYANWILPHGNMGAFKDFNLNDRLLILFVYSLQSSIYPSGPMVVCHMAYVFNLQNWH